MVQLGSDAPALTPSTPAPTHPTHPSAQHPNTCTTAPPHSPPHTPLRFPQGLIFVEVDSKHVIVDTKGGKVQCADEALRGRVDRALRRMGAAMQPCQVESES